MCVRECVDRPTDRDAVFMFELPIRICHITHPFGHSGPRTHYMRTWTHARARSHAACPANMPPHEWVVPIVYARMHVCVKGKHERTE